MNPPDGSKSARITSMPALVALFCIWEKIRSKSTTGLRRPGGAFLPKGMAMKQTGRIFLAARIRVTTA
jgi:hypothetical protein